MISDVAADREGDRVEPDDVRWPLERVLDTVGLVLAGVVLVRGIGGFLAGVGVTSFQVNLGATSGSGVVVNSGVALPTSARLQYGTSWADITSGLMLLAAVGVITVPRMVWDIPGVGAWSRLHPWSVIGIGVLAALTAARAVIGTVNWVWNANANPAVATGIAAGVAAVALTALIAVLSWFALPYLVTPRPQDEHTSS